MRLSHVRFTTRRIMLSIAFLAVGFALTRHVIMRWGPREILTIVPLLFVLTNLLAGLQRPRWQVFWIGFGICGWAYLAISLGSPIAEYLPTTLLLDRLYDLWYPNQTGSLTFDRFGDGGSSTLVSGEDFRRAGQWVLSLVFAILGGGAAFVLIPPRVKGDVVPLLPEGSLLGPGWRAEASDCL